MNTYSCGRRAEIAADPAWPWPNRHSDLGIILRLLGRLRRFAAIRDIVRYVIVPMLLWPGRIVYGGPGGSILVRMPNGECYVDGMFVGCEVEAYSRHGDTVYALQRKVPHVEERYLPEFWEQTQHELRTVSLANLARGKAYAPVTDAILRHVIFGDRPRHVHMRAGVIEITLKDASDIKVVIAGDLYLNRFIDGRMTARGAEFTLWDGRRTAWIAVGVPHRVPFRLTKIREEMLADLVPEYMPRYEGGPVERYEFQYDVVSVWRACHIFGLTVWGERIQARFVALPQTAPQC